MSGPDLSKMSDEDLDKIISGNDVTQAPPGQGLATLEARNAAVAAKQPKATAEEIEPSALRRGLAAMGGALQEPVLGAAEKLQLAFPGKGAAGDANTARLAEDRAQRRKHMQTLTATPAGMAGEFMGHALPAVLAPPAVGPQMALAGGLGFLGGGPDRPTGLTNELMHSGMTGGIDAATAGLIMKGIDVAGKGANAARKAYSPEGTRAMAIDDAAHRMGIDNLSAGQLYPNSPMGQIATRLPTYPDEVAQQAGKMSTALAAEREVPSAVGTGVEKQVLPGGNLADDLAGAAKARLDQGRAKYTAVDEFASLNNLSNLDPKYSLPQLTSLQRKAVKGDDASLLAVNMMAHSNPESLAWLGSALQNGMTPAQIKAAGIPMATYHDMRVAVGKAIGNLDRVNPANKTTVQWQAQKLLLDLKTGLDNEAEDWAKHNAGNREAMDLYNSAKKFYANVVAPSILENPVARKSISRTKGWNDLNPGPMYSAILNSQNAGLVDVLRPTMNQRGLDSLDVLQGVPDIGRMLATGQAPATSGRGALGELTKAAMGHPVLAAAEMTPGLGWLTRTRPVKRLVSARSPLAGTAGRSLAGVAQLPQDSASEKVRNLLDMSRQ